MDNLLTPAWRARLREERKRLGYTQNDFAERAGIKRVSQYLYETDEESNPGIRYFDAIAKLGVDLHYVFFNQRGGAEDVFLNPKRLREIYRLVDEIARDDKGNPLPLDKRTDFFSVLCATYSSGIDNVIDLKTVKRLLK